MKDGTEHAANKMEIKGQGEEIQELRKNSLKLERERLVRIKGKNLPKKVENEDVASLVIKVIFFQSFECLDNSNLFIRFSCNFQGSSLYDLLSRDSKEIMKDKGIYIFRFQTDYDENLSFIAHLSTHLSASTVSPW